MLGHRMHSCRHAVAVNWPKGNAEESHDVEDDNDGFGAAAMRMTTMASISIENLRALNFDALLWMRSDGVWPATLSPSTQRLPRPTQPTA